MDVTVNISNAGKWIKHSFTRGRPVAVDEEWHSGDHTFHIVFSNTIRKGIAAAELQGEDELLKLEIYEQFIPSIEHVRWLK